MKFFKYECCACGSTDISYKHCVDNIIDLTVESGCCNCGSKEIQRYTLRCDECQEKNLIDDIRFEIICTDCGLVNADTDPNTDYPLGFILCRPNLKLR